jgi:hypothetical protein
MSTDMDGEMKLLVAELRDIRQRFVFQGGSEYARAIADFIEKGAESRSENICDACAGTGKPVSGLPCMCGGTGKASRAVMHLRERLIEAEFERDALRQLVSDVEWKARLVSERACRLPRETDSVFMARLKALLDKLHRPLQKHDAARDRRELQAAGQVYSVAIDDAVRKT